MTEQHNSVWSLCVPCHGTKARPTLTEAEAIEKAREVWPEAEGFELTFGGWTFRVGAGYASVTTLGTVATDPQGTRAHVNVQVSRHPSLPEGLRGSGIPGRTTTRAA